MKSLFLSIFLVITSFVYAQVQTFQAEYLNMRLYNDSTKQLDDWVGWNPSDVVGVMTDKKVVIFSNYEQKYIIITDIKKIEEKDKRIIAFDAINLKGERCTIELVNNFEDGKFYLYIRWTYLQLCYQIRKL